MESSSLKSDALDEGRIQLQNERPADGEKMRIPQQVDVENTDNVLPEESIQ